MELPQNLFPPDIQFFNHLLYILDLIWCSDDHQRVGVFIVGNANTRVKAATAEELLLDSPDEDFPSLELFLELFLVISEIIP